jgi:outer membrane protein
MRNKLIALIVLVLSAGAVSAQRYAYVDTEFILDNMPEYTEAQEELNKASKDWQEEIETLFADVEKKRRDYEAEAILLPAEIKKQRENEIEAADAKAKEMQKRRFGVGGDLFMKREELIKPIQDKIFNAIQQVAQKQNYAFVFDKANQSNLLYADTKLDVSEDVLREMGIKIDRK